MVGGGGGDSGASFICACSCSGLCVCLCGTAGPHLSVLVAAAVDVCVCLCGTAGPQSATPRSNYSATFHPHQLDLRIGGFTHSMWGCLH